MRQALRARSWVPRMGRDQTARFSGRWGQQAMRNSSATSGHRSVCGVSLPPPDHNFCIPKFLRTKSARVFSRPRAQKIGRKVLLCKQFWYANCLHKTADIRAPFAYQNFPKVLLCRLQSSRAQNREGICIPKVCIPKLFIQFLEQILARSFWYAIF